MIDFNSPAYAGKELVFEKHACEFLGLEPGTLNYIIRKGADIPYYLVTSNTKMFDKAELVTWWKAHKKNGIAPEDVPPPPAPYVPTVRASVSKQQQVEQEHLEALRAQKAGKTAKPSA
jgi:hypothetical protein